MADKKKFGLVMPKKSDAFKMKKNSIFNDDSDEDERVRKRPKIPQKKMDLKSKLKIESAEDPSIYEYDDIYDEMKRKQKEEIAPKEKKNSRYIETLLKAAEKRKKEYERRIDKKIQAEREKEGDQFKDKEAFVTSSYKKKMLEQEEEEEKERRENMLNDMMDVTKQKDLSGFYRHFLKQTVGEEKIPKFGERQIKEEVMSDDGSHKSPNNSPPKCQNIDQDTDSVESDDSESSDDGDEKSDTEKGKEKTSDNSKSQSKEHTSRSDKSKTSLSRKQREKNYRKSMEVSNSSESEEDDYSTGKNDQSDETKSNKSKSTNVHNLRHDSDSSSAEDSDHQPSEKIADTDENCNKSTKKRKVNISEKRTVGDTFAEAQARYFQRMASRKAEI